MKNRLGSEGTQKIITKEHVRGIGREGKGEYGKVDKETPIMTTQCEETGNNILLQKFQNIRFKPMMLLLNFFLKTRITLGML